MSLVPEPLDKGLRTTIFLPIYSDEEEAGDPSYMLKDSFRRKGDFVNGIISIRIFLDFRT